MSGSGLESGASGGSDSIAIGDGTGRAGLSNELDVTNLTPPKELSSGPRDYNLAIGADNLTDAGLLSNKIEELSVMQCSSSLVLDNPLMSRMKHQMEVLIY